MEKFIEQLKKIKKGVDFEHETSLIDGGFLKSFDVIQIIGMIDREYGISVPPSQIIPDNFNSAKAMWDMMDRLEN
ncbi:MAG: acyl carrier protein [Parasporobacterium sp.]|nr:acyl carrier protein [Parasporobacterium sp.]